MIKDVKVVSNSKGGRFWLKVELQTVRDAPQASGLSQGKANYAYGPNPSHCLFGKSGFLVKSQSFIYILSIAAFIHRGRFE